MTTAKPLDLEKKNNRKKRVSISLNEDQFARLRAVAVSQHRTVSNLVESFIVAYAAKHAPEMIAKLNQHANH